MSQQTFSPGLRLKVLRAADGDCSNGGLTSRHSQLTLVGVVDKTEDRANQTVQPLAASAQIHAAHEDAPPVLLVLRRVGRTIVQHLEQPPTDGKWFMSGGNYAVGAGPQFEQLVGHRGAVQVHDRHEASR